MLYVPKAGGLNKLSQMEITRIRETYKQLKSIQKTADLLQYSKNTVNKYVKDLSSQNKKSRYNNKKVIKLDTQGNKIRVFKNANLAAKLCHIAADNLNHCLRGRTHSAGGYLWCYEDELAEVVIPNKIYVSQVRQIDVLLGLK